MAEVPARTIFISDTTLRDGEQAAGVIFAQVGLCRHGLPSGSRQLLVEVREAAQEKKRQLDDDGLWMLYLRNFGCRLAV